MPFKSKAQMRKIFALEAKGKVPKGTGRRWAHHTTDISNLPDYLEQRKKKKEHEKRGAITLRGIAAGFFDELEKIAKKKKKKRKMPHFTEQDRPKKVKDIYRALKRDHPGMSAEKKARIAAKFGKPGVQHPGPPYSGPLSKAGQDEQIAPLQVSSPVEKRMYDVDTAFKRGQRSVRFKQMAMGAPLQTQVNPGGQ